MAETGREAPSRHLGLDLGGTNIKAVVVEHEVDDWRVLDRDQVGTPAAQGPDRVVARLAEVGAEAIGRCPGVSSVGIGIIVEPGCWPGRPKSRMKTGFAGLLRS